MFQLDNLHAIALTKQRSRQTIGISRLADPRGPIRSLCGVASIFESSLIEVNYSFSNLSITLCLSCNADMQSTKKCHSIAG